MIIKNYRKSKGISQDTASKELGVTIDTYRTWERKIKKVIPRANRIKKIHEWSGGEVSYADWYKEDDA